MRNKLLLMLLMTSAAVIVGCARSGVDVKTPRPECPQPQAPPPSLMAPPDYEKRLLDELLESEPKPTPTSEGFKKP